MTHSSDMAVLVERLREALEKWRLRDGYMPAYIAGWNAMIDQALREVADAALATPSAVGGVDRMREAPLFTAESIAKAHRETERLSRELDITNADHIALWLEANLGDASLGWLAVRIVEAHEAALASGETSPEKSNTSD